MTDRDPALLRSTSPAQADESLKGRETPFSLIWLHAVDPRIFTPYTWKYGRATTIRFQGLDGSTGVNVERIVAHRLDNTMRMYDEVHLVLGGNEAGNRGEITKLQYGFDSSEQLVGFDPAPTLSEHLQRMVHTMSQFVQTPGSTISASNHNTGIESRFVSDGTRWIDLLSGLPAPLLPEIAIGRLALNPPNPELPDLK